MCEYLNQGTDKTEKARFNLTCFFKRHKYSQFWEAIPEKSRARAKAQAFPRLHSFSEVPHMSKQPLPLHQPTTRAPLQSKRGFALKTTAQAAMLALPLGMLGLTGQAHAGAANTCMGTTVLHAAADGSAAADGLSWGSATTLYGALAISNADTTTHCFEIRLKQGVYKPATLNPAETDTDVIYEARYQHFAVTRPVQLKGGYTGVGETREIKAENTVLSGDIDGNDTTSNGITRKALAVADGSTGNWSSSGDIVGNNSIAVMLLRDSGYGSNQLQFTSSPQDLSFTQLEGLTITGASAFADAGESYDDSSGGLVCSIAPNAQPALARTLKDMATDSETACAPLLKNMLFAGNAGRNGGGLVVLNGSGTSRLTVQDSEFSGNFARESGGAISLYPTHLGSASVPTNRARIDVSNSAFNDNRAIRSGGGISFSMASAVDSASELNISQSSFRGNTASAPTPALVKASGHPESTGGAIAVTPMAMDRYPATLVNTRISDSSFENNQADDMGGALITQAGNYSSLTTQVNGSTFTQNAAQRGGAIGNLSTMGGANSALTITNSTFDSNTAVVSGAPDLYWYGRGSGGAILTAATGEGGDATLAVNLSTFNANVASESGSAIQNLILSANRSTLSVDRSILWATPTPGETPVVANSAIGWNPDTYSLVFTPADPLNSGATAALNSNIVQGGWTANGTGNIDADPMLSPIANNGGLTSTLLPQSGSPAIDAIACDAAVTTDQRGKARPQTSGAQCDIGAVELQQFKLDVTVTPGAGAAGSVSATAGAAPVDPAKPIANCGSSDAAAQCGASYSETAGGTKVTLTATPASGFRLSEWTGACVGNTTTCEVTLDASKSVQALFVRSAATTGSGLTPAGDPITLALGDNTTCQLSGTGPVFSPAPASGAPAGYTFPFGQVSFVANGCAHDAPLNITLALPNASSLPSGAVLFKRIGSTWTPWPGTFSGNSVQFAVRDSIDASSASTTGDNDPTPGTIADPVLIAVPQGAVAAAPLAVPTLGQWGLVLLGSVLAMFGVPALRRKGGQR